jgi:phosphoketolase
VHKPPVVILSGVRWDFLWQRHQTLATHFAGAGYPTVFVETTGLANPRLTGNTLRRIFERSHRLGETSSCTRRSPPRRPTEHSGG